MIITSLLSGAIQSGTSVLFAVYGETMTERVGVINLGTEGCMIVGALTAYGITANTGSPWLGLIGAGIIAGLFSLIHGYLVVNRKANQLATGLTLMFLGIGLTAFLGRNYVSVQVEGFSKVPIPLLSSIPIIGQAIFNQDIITYISYITGPVLWALLYKTRFGMLLRGTGEDENVIYAYGSNPIIIRYLGILIGGVLSGIGGAQLSIAYTHTWIEGMTNGRGVIAVALVILAAWNPAKAIIGAYIFGGAQALQLILQQQGYNISPFLLLMLPYVFTLISLFIATRKQKQSMPAELKKIIESSAGN